MKMNIQYLTVFLDADLVRCVFVKDVLFKFKGIGKIKGFYQKTWEIGKRSVMALDDLKVLWNRTRKCRNGHIVIKETNKKLKKEYPYFCPTCNENMYAIETEF